MAAQKLTRTSYRNQDGSERLGDTARTESLFDVEQYNQPTERIHGGDLHERGIASGLQVTATLGQPGVRVLPGVALDAQGRHISLAPGGQAKLDENTLVDVSPQGVSLPTTGLVDTRHVTISFAETFDTGIPGVPRVDDTPLLQFYDAGNLPRDGSRVVLATVILDAAGNVTDLRRDQRRATGLPAERIVLRRGVRATASDTLTVEHEPTAELRARPSGGLDVRVTRNTDEIDLGRDGGSFAKLSITAESLVARRSDGTQTLSVDVAAGNLAIGSATKPLTALHLPERGLQIGTRTTASDNFHWASDLNNGTRGLRLYNGNYGSNSHLLTVLANPGRVGIGTTTPSQPLTVHGEANAYLNLRTSSGVETLIGADGGGGMVSTMTNHDLQLRAGANSTKVTIKTDGKVGIGEQNPGHRLDVSDRIRLRQGQSGTAGIWLFQSGADRAFVGMFDKDKVGLWGNPVGWGLSMNIATGQVGIGTENPKARLEARTGNGPAAVFVNNDQNSSTLHVENIAGGGTAICGTVTSGIALAGIAKNIGVFAKGDSAAGHFVGNVAITGTLTKAGGQFRIDHPEDPANQYLSHAFVESDEMKNVYDGAVELDVNGEAEVELAGWCEALNRGFRYQLTPIGSPAPDLHIAQEFSANRFKIAGGQPGMRVCWQVTGVRQDAYALAHPLIVEEEKSPTERGYYLHPELHGQPIEQSIEWAVEPRASRRVDRNLQRLQRLADQQTQDTSEKERS